ncbi:M15 family metallopeptidase [bacterium]|nr:M15 family metallopeptidase [bacterium]
MRIFIILSLFIPIFLWGDFESVVTPKGEKRQLEVIRDLKRFPLKDIKEFIPDADVDIQYAQKGNKLFKESVYSENICYIHPELGKKLAKIDSELKKKYGLKLKFWDCYRPWSVQKKMWDLYPKLGYVGHPAYGSRHNRGIAVDVTLIDIKTLKKIEMPTEFDELSSKANHTNMNLSKKVLKNRAILKNIMEKYEIFSIRTEWWHYNLPTKKHPVYDIPLSKLK